MTTVEVSSTGDTKLERVMRRVRSVGFVGAVAFYVKSYFPNITNTNVPFFDRLHNVFDVNSDRYRQPWEIYTLWEKTLGTVRLRAHTSDIHTLVEMRGNMYTIPEVFNRDRFPSVYLIDLGSNIGLATKKIYIQLRRLGINVPRMILVEPDPGNITFSRENLSRIEGIEQIEAAISNTNETRILTYPSGIKGTDSYSIRVEGKGTPVNCITLKEVTSDVSSPIILKVDIEGAENDFLDIPDIDKVLVNVQLIFIEDHTGNHVIKELKEYDFAKVDKTLRSLGFTQLGQDNKDRVYIRARDDSNVRPTA